MCMFPLFCFLSNMDYINTLHVATYNIHVYTFKKPVKRFRVGKLTQVKWDMANIIKYKWVFFSNLQSLLNFVLKFRVTQYFKSVIIIVEYNKSFVKKPTFNKKSHFFTESTQPSGLNGYVPGYIPRPTLISTPTIHPGSPEQEITGQQPERRLSTGRSTVRNLLLRTKISLLDSPPRASPPRRISPFWAGISFLMRHGPHSPPLGQTISP